MSLQFLSLASGSSGNCYYLGTEDYGILIDAGKGVRTIKKVLREYGIPFEKIVALCITHDHADHIKAAGTLGEKFGIPIYTTETIKNGMNRNYCMVDKVYSAHRAIIKEVPFKIRDFTITAFEVPHDGSDNVGFLVTYGNLHFAFATDLGTITPTADKYLRQANYLVIESNYDHEMLRSGPYPKVLQDRICGGFGHLSNAECAEAVRGFAHDGLRNVFLCHLSDHNNTPQLAFGCTRAVLAPSVRLVPLPRQTPSPLFLL